MAFVSRRRTTLAAAVSLMAPIARAQERKPTVVALLSWWPASMEAVYVDHLREGLRRYGYVEGRNLELLASFVGGDVERCREAATRFVERGVDVIVAAATPAATIAKQATATRRIPIVMAPVADPLATGLVDSIARPGGHLTGMAMIGPDLTGKRLQFLREIMPALRSIAFIGSTRDPNAHTFAAALQSASGTLGLRLSVKMIDAAPQIDAALMEEFKRDGAEAIIVQPIFMGHQERIAAAAQAARLPFISDFPAFATAGALFSYGVDDRAQMRRAAYFVDRIVRGASPADLPIELPTDATLIVNQRTAATLGLIVPRIVLQAANEVIE
jgi:putative ABC transport system substrate-binding protein